MHWSNYFSRIAIFLLIVTGYTYGYKFYQDELPNGDRIPHPCKPNYIWQGVGHKNTLGGGSRNPFGEEFAQNGHMWTEALCNADSDGDGKSNGEELGDPNCQWRKGQIPEVTDNLSHPGVCEPVNSTVCQQENTWEIDCTRGEFTCPAIEDPDVFNYTIQFPETPVPAQETTYICQQFPLPGEANMSYHIIGLKQLIDNHDIMHHIALRACSMPTDQYKAPEECGMGSAGCVVIGGWTVGFDGECLPDDLGIRISGRRYTHLLMQHHWNNPRKLSTYTDKSGMTLFLTPVMRQYDIGMIITGQLSLDIPPVTKHTQATGVCTSKCTRNNLKDVLHVVSASLHMHYMGRSGRLEHWRSGQLIQMLINQTDYSYDRPTTYDFKMPVEVRPGDELRTVCDFDSSVSKEWTHFGDSTQDEMCLSFLKYYPDENGPKVACVSYGSADLCTESHPDNGGSGRHPATLQGCKTALFITSGRLSEYHERVTEVCDESCGEDECWTVVQEVEQDYKECLSPENIRYFNRRKAVSKNFVRIMKGCEAKRESRTSDDGWNHADKNTHVGIILLTLQLFLLALL